MGLFSGDKKGKLVICDENGNKQKEVEFMFNPESYSIASNPSYKDNSAVGKEASAPEFIKAATRTLSATLFFDSYAALMPTSAPLSLLMGVTALTSVAESKIKPVTNTIKNIQEAVMIAGSQHKPPLVQFQWGNLNFKGVIQSMTEEYTMFTQSGKPTRAKVQLTIEEVVEAGVSKRKSPFESPDRTKSRVLVEGMSLWQIAEEEYNDAEKWRVIARANRIMNPMDIVPGMVISIPAITSKEE